MYKLILADGTTIDNIMRVNPSTFEIESNDPQIYWELSQDNLAFATLYKDDELEEMYIDCARTSYTMQNGLIHFRIGPIKEAQG